ncbi:DUF6300 family protein [Streptomyces mirabilis]
MCDTGDVHRPAAGLLVQWFANDGGHDESRVKEGSHLLMEWTKECMAAQAGTCRTPRPTSPELSSAEAGGRAVLPRRTSSAAAGSNYCWGRGDNVRLPWRPHRSAAGTHPGAGRPHRPVHAAALLRRTDGGLAAP